MRFRRALYWLSVAVFSLAALLLAAGYFLIPDCEGDSPRAAFARSIPRARLATLFEDVRRLGPWIGPRRRDEIPVEFSDLGVIAIGGASFPGSTHLRLAGCFDHHLDLVVLGADGEARDGDPRIDLIWGEVPHLGSETLWRQGDE